MRIARLPGVRNLTVAEPEPADSTEHDGAAVRNLTQPLDANGAHATGLPFELVAAGHPRDLVRTVLGLELAAGRVILEGDNYRLAPGALDPATARALRALRGL